MPKNPYTYQDIANTSNRPRRGLKHSDIMRRRGENVSSLLSVFDKTEFGLGKTLEKNKKFSVDLETLAPGSAKPYGANSKEARVLYVVKGTLFIKYERDGVVSQQAYTDGAYFVIPAGMPHNYAASGTTEVSVLCISGGDYNKGFKSLEEGVVSTKEIEMPSQTPKNTITFQKRDRSNSIAKRQAAEFKKERDKLDGTAGQSKVVSPFDVLADPNYKVQNVKPRGAGGIAGD